MVTQAAPGALGGTFCSQFQMTRLGQGQWQQLIHSPVNSHSSGGTCTGSTDVGLAVGRERAIIVQWGS